MMQNLEETLREVCCLGDLEKVRILIGYGVNINSQNKVNGWTGLHWAAKRNHKDTISYLLSNGADPTIRTFKEERAIDLTRNNEIKQLLSTGGEQVIFEEDGASALPGNVDFVPNYLLNPEFPYSESTVEFARKLGIHQSPIRTSNSSSGVLDRSDALSFSNDKQKEHLEKSNAEKNKDNLVLKVRVAEAKEKDFVEIELDRKCISFTALVDACLKEFDVERIKLKKVRKMPNTIVRNDRDVQRLKQFQEMEIVIE